MDNETTYQIHLDEDISKFNPIAEFLYQDFIASGKKSITIVCIGSDRSTGDSLGPLIGTIIQKKAKPIPYVNFVGTLQFPIHATNLKSTLKSIPKTDFIVAVDASLGKIKEVGLVKYKRKSLQPGEGLKKVLPPVGDVHVVGVVNVESGELSYAVLQNTQLSVVYRMAEKIATTLLKFAARIQTKNNHRNLDNVG